MKSVVVALVTAFAVLSLGAAPVGAAGLNVGGYIVQGSQVDRWYFSIGQTTYMEFDVRAYEKDWCWGWTYAMFGTGYGDDRLDSHIYLFRVDGSYLASNDNCSIYPASGSFYECSKFGMTPKGYGSYDASRSNYDSYLGLWLQPGEYMLSIGASYLGMADAWDGLKENDLRGYQGGYSLGFKAGGTVMPVVMPFQEWLDLNANHAPLAGSASASPLAGSDTGFELTAQVSDDDGDSLTWEWTHDLAVVCAGEIDTPDDGSALALPACQVEGLAPGEHLFVLQVSDPQGLAGESTVQVLVVDECPGFDDHLDADGDGTADGCDACPSDVYGDSDGDGTCDSSDPCYLDAENDSDGDDLCANVDPCPLDPANDADGDGVCANQDPCPQDAFNDADGDGVCGNLDACPGGDDGADADGDGTADFCDLCPIDPLNDADDDGLCAHEDPCPLDPANDVDGDGLCANDDACPLDADNDADGDGVCGDTDPCPVDSANDADGDGLCESSDNCPSVANTNQANMDGDTYGDACEPDNDEDGVIDDFDNCPLDGNANQLDSDGDGTGDACDADDDGDGIVDGQDVCLGTLSGSPVLADGCSVEQECACAAAWKNHGAYVGCVAKASEWLLAAGKISQAQKDALCSAAGKSACGDRKKP